jgi:AraC-like DNA-binding protein
MDSSDERDRSRGGAVTPRMTDHASPVNDFTVVHFDAPQPFELVRARYTTRVFPPHFHDYFSVGVLEAGTAVNSHRTRSIRISKGDVIAVNPGEVHAGGPAGHTGWAYTMFCLPPSLLATVASESGGALTTQVEFCQPLYRDRALSSRLLNLRDLLLTSEDVFTREVATVDLVGQLLRYCSGVPVPRDAADRSKMLRIREYLRDAYAQPLSIADLSAVVQLSPYHLIRRFHKTFGLPPHAYLENVRIEHARELLRSGRSAAFAAYAVGFCDQSHFTRRFARLVGISPGRYARAAHCRS